MPDIIPTTQDVVLDRVVARLIAQVSGLNAANCYQTVEPYPSADVGHGTFCHVSPGPGQYGQEALAGGGINTPFENASTWVTVFTRVRLDQPNHAERILKDASRGLLTFKRLILKALVGHNLLDANGNPLLIDYIYPTQATQPQLNEQDKVAFVSVAFNTNFEWDLTL